MGRSLRTLFCALLATAIVPSTLSAAYAEVQAVRTVESEAVAVSPVAKAPGSPRVAARSFPLPLPSPLADRFYLRYCRLLR